MPRAEAPLRTRLLLLAACASLAACAGAQKPRPDVVWPLPPEKPRVKWVRSFASNDDLKHGTLSAIGRAFLPGEAGVAVAQPTGLALSPDERFLYVACNSAARVLAVDLVKGSMNLTATSGTRPVAPFGVATDGEGNLYVTDHIANDVKVYRGSDGSFLRKFGEGKVDRPTGIVVDARRQVVYVTAGASSASKHHRVEVFSLKGQHLRTIGTRGHDPGQFNFPVNLALAKNGQLYVVDMLNFRVQVFDPDGQLVTTFGRVGAGEPGTFDKPKGLAFDGFGNLYVVDSQQSYVQLFNTKHQPLMAFGGFGLEPGYMSLPTAIVISSKNAIYVADFALSAVHEYQLFNTTAADSFAPDQKPTPPSGGPQRAPPPTPSGQKAQGG
jgi:DNA-binding beta-propeller fold protein YncE